MPKPKAPAVLTPDFSDVDYAALPEHNKKGAVLFFLEAQARRIKAQQDIIQSQQQHINKITRFYKKLLVPVMYPAPKDAN